MLQETENAKVVRRTPCNLLACLADTFKSTASIKTIKSFALGYRGF